MYSKCIVDPFNKHPMAMTASKAEVDAVLVDWDSGVGVLGLLSVSIKERRLVVDGSIDGALLADCV
jgi:hypothetical protein